MTYILSGTGSRSLATAGTETAHRIADAIHLKLRQTKILHPDFQVMAGGAKGFDFLLAESAYFAKVPYILALPNKGYLPYYWPIMSDHEKAVFDTAIEQRFVCKSLYENGLHSNMVRNLYMVKHSSFMLVYNPTTPGTSHCFKAIKEAKRDYMILI